MATFAGYQLTEGFLEKLISGELNRTMEPIFQILAIKKLTNFTKKPDEENRYRLKVSDGRTVNSFVVLSDSLSHLVESNALAEYSIIKVNRYHINPTKHNGKMTFVMIVLKMEILVPGSVVRNVLGQAGFALMEERLSYIDLQD